MANTQPGILRNLRVKRVALVDIGANFDVNTGDGAHIMLFKRHEIDKNGPSLGAVHVDAPADPKAAARRKLEDEANKNKKEKRMSAKTLLKNMLGLMGETDATKRAEGLALVTKSIDDLPDDSVAKVAHDPDAEMCKCTDCMAKAKRFDGDVAAAVSKATTDMEKAHRIEMETITKANKALADAIEVEKNIRLDAEMVAVLKSFRATPFDMATDVAKFRKMKEVAPEAYDRTMAVLKAADAQLAASGIYSQMGTSTGGSSVGPDAAWAQIEAKADEMVTKSTAGLTREAAIEKVLLNPANKELVKQYRGVSAN